MMTVDELMSVNATTTALSIFLHKCYLSIISLYNGIGYQIFMIVILFYYQGPSGYQTFITSHTAEWATLAK